MTTQTGPRLTITGTCEGCAWLHPIGAIRGLVYFCNEPSKRVGEFAKPTEIGRKPTTPEWCPLLPAARLALARSVVAAHDRKGAANCQRREEMWERMTQHHRLTTADPSAAPAVTFGPLRIGCDCGAPRGVTCADHYAGEPQ